MFVFLSTSEIQFLQAKYPDDIFVIIDSRIKNKEDLISFYSISINSPYSDDNWDGLEDALMELSWLQNSYVRIVHYELPILPKQELNTYLSILRNVDSIWSTSRIVAKNSSFQGCNGVIVYFNIELLCEILD